MGKGEGLRGDVFALTKSSWRNRGRKGISTRVGLTWGAPRMGTFRAKQGPSLKGGVVRRPHCSWKPEL